MAMKLVHTSATVALVASLLLCLTCNSCSEDVSVRAPSVPLRASADSSASTKALGASVPGLQSAKDDCFRAAVVSFSPVITGNCQADAQKNLEIYEKIARAARREGVQVLVFPEGGIFLGQNVAPCLEDIPEPVQGLGYIPCIQRERFGQSHSILARLSCLARDNQLYLAANYGTREKVREGEWLMLNTDVVFDPAGEFIGRYRKWHPFVIGEIYAKAPRLEHLFFDTEYGRFGVFTCFDILFKQPALDLVQQYAIDTAIFPTNWLDEVPLLPALQVQDGWSWANQVNLLGANLVNPPTGSVGSGIFSGNRSLYFTSGPAVPKGGPIRTRILISTLPVRPPRGARASEQSACKAEPDQKVIEIEDNPNWQSHNMLNYSPMPSDTIEPLSGPRNRKTLRSGQVRCTVDYELEVGADARQLDRVIVLVRDSPRDAGWYEQVCTVATLAQSYESSRGSLKAPRQLNFATEGAVKFRKLSVRAEFETSHVFPSCAHNLTQLVERDQREFVCDRPFGGVLARGAGNVCELSYRPATAESGGAKKIYAFGLYGRVYERDPANL